MDTKRPKKSDTVPHGRSSSLGVFRNEATALLPEGLDPEQVLFIKVIKGKDANNKDFTAYVLMTETQKNELEVSKKATLKKYEIFYSKFGHTVTDELHREIMEFFALRYLNRPLRYVVDDRPLDKEFFTEADFKETEPFLVTQVKVKHLRVRPEKLFSEEAAPIQHTTHPIQGKSL